MKKKLLLIGIAVFILAAILFVPIPKSSYDDGGTREYVSLTYKIVDWNKIYEDGTFDKTKIYFGLDKDKSIDELWIKESQNITSSFLAYIIAMTENSVTVAPFENEPEYLSACEIIFPTQNIQKLDVKIGDSVKVSYTGTIMETFPAQINVVSWEKSDKTPPQLICVAKPVIYLYPEKETDVSVKLSYGGTLTTTYPEYKGIWNVTAFPDGTLKDKDGKIYNYLYWEGISDAVYDFSEGFCIKGEDTAAFLEDALSKLGLNRREANEFIVYWLPIMEKNEYNIISFQNKVYQDLAKLDIDPAPDTLIRVFMAFKKSDKAEDIKPQKLSAPARNGFTVIEWGGSEVK